MAPRQDVQDTSLPSRPIREGVPCPLGLPRLTSVQSLQPHPRPMGPILVQNAGPWFPGALHQLEAD